MLRIGHCYMSDLTDALGVDSKTSGAAVENLDQGGLVRAGMAAPSSTPLPSPRRGWRPCPPTGGRPNGRGVPEPLYVQLLKVVKL